MLLAGIVTYNPDIENVKQQINSISDCVDIIIIVDNNSKNIDQLDKLCNCYKNINIIKNTKNLGIAKALNQIMTYAKNNGYKWVLSLDQDSKIDSELVSALLKGCNIPNVGAICPIIFDVNSNRIALVQDKTPCKESSCFFEVSKCITSGSITSVEAWEKVGEYDEFLFIDMVDFDFCKRLIINNYRIIENSEAVLNHQIGKTTYRHFLWIEVGVMNHNAFRKYYMIRNRIYCNYKYYNKFGVRNVIGVLKTIIIVIFYEKDKRAKLKSIFRGIIDGIKTGKSLKSKN